MENSARLFHCAGCHCQVLICTNCDRGNIYCSTCSISVAVQLHREASKRYQNTQRGKRNHASRQNRYRQKKNKVTDGGSTIPSPNDLLPLVSNEQENADKVLGPVDIHCHFCGRCCSEFMRSGFLRHPVKNEKEIPSFFARAP